LLYTPLALSPVSIQTQSLAFLAVFVYATHATHATQAIAFEWKPGLRRRQKRKEQSIQKTNRLTHIFTFI